MIRPRYGGYTGSFDSWFLMMRVHNTWLEDAHMLRTFHALPITMLRSGVGFCAPEHVLRERVGFHDPALEVMTDFKLVSAVVIRPTDGIDDALSRMKQRKVRSLLVIDNERIVVGLITANDVLGEKPMRFVESQNVRHEDIRVGDVMTPIHELEAIEIGVVKNAKVGHVVATLQTSGRQHTLVTEPDGRVRGMFSATQIARQLGVEADSINPTEIRKTFAEIRELLAR
jgi:CBS domain containing-hemolysin-like protein